MLRVSIFGFSVYVVPIFFFPFDFELSISQRLNIPANIQQATTSSQMDTTTWGIPTAAYPNSACSMQTFFPPQQLVLLTTLCGVWYGSTVTPYTEIQFNPWRSLS